MKTKTKSAFVLLVTLTLGLILGVLLQTAIQNQRNERMRSLRDRGALPDIIIHVVEPRDEAQENAIREIVTRYEESHADMLRDYWEARSSLFDAMHEELVSNVLFEDQVEALSAWRERNRRSNRSGNQQGGSERTNENSNDSRENGRRR